MQDWQLDRIVDKFKNLPDVHLTNLRYMNGKFYHVSYAGRTSYAMTPNEVDAYIRRTQLIANVAYKSVDNRIVIVYTDRYSQRELENLMRPFVATEANFVVEMMWLHD